MVCVYCGAATKVTNSRRQSRNNQTWRRRRCSQCGAIFTSIEAPLHSTVYSVKHESRLEPFLPDKLFAEVLLAVQDRKDCYEAARELTNTIINKLAKHSAAPTYDSVAISQTASEVLKRFDKRAWLRYVTEHPSLEL